MKLWPILLLLSGCQAAVILTPRNPDDFGSVVTYQKQNLLGEYESGYQEGHASGATFRRESGDAFGNKVGSYGLRDSDGRLRIVSYIADSNGFRAEITTNEPGIVPQNPASASINKPAILPFNAAPAVPVVPVSPGAPVAFPPPLPPPLPAPVAVPTKAFPPPPVSYRYITQPATRVAVPPPPPPPPAYFPPRFTAPVAPIATPVAPVAVPKGVAAYPPPPSPYYANFVQGKGYVNAVRTYTNLFPPLAAVPPQYNYLKSPSPYETINFVL